MSVQDWSEQLPAAIGASSKHVVDREKRQKSAMTCEQCGAMSLPPSLQYPSPEVLHQPLQVFATLLQSLRK
jgi:hypothetical protein